MQTIIDLSIREETYRKRETSKQKEIFKDKIVVITTG